MRKVRRGLMTRERQEKNDREARTVRTLPRLVKLWAERLKLARDGPGSRCFLQSFRSTSVAMTGVLVTHAQRSLLQ